MTKIHLKNMRVTQEENEIDLNIFYIVEEKHIPAKNHKKHGVAWSRPLLLEIAIIFTWMRPWTRCPRYRRRRWCQSHWTSRRRHRCETRHPGPCRTHHSLLQAGARPEWICGCKRVKLLINLIGLVPVPCTDILDISISKHEFYN